MHSKAPHSLVHGVLQRFCQQCSRFHPLPQFDEGKRSCRRRLAGHNKRRRKPHPDLMSAGVPLSEGHNLVPQTKILCVYHGKYVLQEVSVSKNENIAALSGSEKSVEHVQKIHFPGGPANIIGRCFVEVEHDLFGNILPVIVADSAVCAEIRSLEKELDSVCRWKSSDSADDSCTDSESEAFKFLNELGWVFQKSSQSITSSLETSQFELSRFKALLEFAVLHDWCAVVKILLDLLFNTGAKELDGSFDEVMHVLSEVNLLHQAVKRKCRSMVELLLQYIPNCLKSKRQNIFTPVMKGPAGFTPLHVAASISDAEGVIDVLTNDPSEVGLHGWKNACDFSGRTPEWHALNSRNIMYAELIEKKLKAKQSPHMNITVMDMPQSSAGYLKDNTLMIEPPVTSRTTVSNSAQACKNCRAGLRIRSHRPTGMMYRPMLMTIVAIEVEQEMVSYQKCSSDKEISDKNSSQTCRASERDRPHVKVEKRELLQWETTSQMFEHLGHPSNACGSMCVTSGGSKCQLSAADVQVENEPVKKKIDTSNIGSEQVYLEKSENVVTVADESDLPMNMSRSGACTQSEDKQVQKTSDNAEKTLQVDQAKSETDSAEASQLGVEQASAASSGKDAQAKSFSSGSVLNFDEHGLTGASSQSITAHMLRETKSEVGDSLDLLEGSVLYKNARKGSSPTSCKYTQPAEMKLDPLPSAEHETSNDMHVDSEKEIADNASDTDSMAAAILLSFAPKMPFEQNLDITKENKHNVADSFEPDDLFMVPKRNKTIGSRSRNTPDDDMQLFVADMMDDAQFAVDSLLKLICLGNDISTRVEAASVLRAFSSTSKEARWSLADVGAIPLLASVIAKSRREHMQDKFATALQANAMGTLVNIVGGMSAVIACMITKIRFSKPDAHLTDMIDVLAHVLLDFDDTMMAAEVVDAVWIEQVLVQHLTPHAPQLVQQNIMAALTNLYTNIVLHDYISHVEAKRLLLGLIPMVNADLQIDLIESFGALCASDLTLLQSFQGRDIIQPLISLLERSSKQRLEYVVSLLFILVVEVAANEWARVVHTPPLVKQPPWVMHCVKRSLDKQLVWTLAMGINSLVKLLETGPIKTKEHAALILLCLCIHDKDLRACVETAETLLLKSARLKRTMLALNATWCSQKGQLQPSLQDVIISLEHHDVETLQSKCDKAAYEENEKYLAEDKLAENQMEEGLQLMKEDHGHIVNQAEQITDHFAPTTVKEDHGQHVDLDDHDPMREPLQSTDLQFECLDITKNAGSMNMQHLGANVVNFSAYATPCVIDSIQTQTELNHMMVMADSMQELVVLIILALLVDGNPMHGQDNHFPFDPGGSAETHACMDDLYAGDAYHAGYPFDPGG